MGSRVRRMSAKYRLPDVWPRRARGVELPAGQRVARVMPRFSARPNASPPPVPGMPHIEIRGEVATEIRIDLERLESIPRSEHVADFHCVTTWTVRGLQWSGWRFREVWERLIVPNANPAADTTHLRIHGADGYFAVLMIGDALQHDALLVDRLNDEPLDPNHGAPLRFVSPTQYGYKSVKHVTGISICIGEPKRYGGAMEHPRARVELEERHASIPGQLLRWPYRALIIPIAAMARRSAEKAASRPSD